jgi:ABC-type siderophore export system fused ATPase/permease subunit
MRSITPNACADARYFHVADRVIRLDYGSVVEVPAVVQTI